MSNAFTWVWGASMGATEGLSVRGLSAGYGSAQVLDGVSVTVNPGEAVGILGRNGMGKTTLVRALMGAQAPTVSAGEVHWAGTRLSGRPDFLRARVGIGYVPQGRNVFGSLTVEQNLLTTARPLGGGKGWTIDRVYDLFPRLAERRKNRCSNLSGGEQQMVAIGRALMLNPQLLIMDEPSEGLAPAVIGNIRDHMRGLIGMGLSLLLVEQNLAMALSLVDRIYVIALGQIVYEGASEDLRNDPALQRELLGV